MDCLTRLSATLLNLISLRICILQMGMFVHSFKLTSPDRKYLCSPRVHEFIKEMRQKVLSSRRLWLSDQNRISYAALTDYDVMVVGETPYTHTETELHKYVLPPNTELDMLFHFDLMCIDAPIVDDHRIWFVHMDWELNTLRGIIGKWQHYKRNEGYWNTFVISYTPFDNLSDEKSRILMENHDVPRSVTRFGNDSERWRSPSAKMLAILQISQAGTLYIFQGQELALKNLPRTWGIKEYKDIASQNHWKQFVLLSVPIA